MGRVIRYLAKHPWLVILAWFLILMGIGWLLGWPAI